MIRVFIRVSYVDDLKAGLPISYLEFWYAEQEQIDQRAHIVFTQPRPADVEPDYDYVEIRGHWTAGNCDYFVTARKVGDTEIELLRIEFDLDPLQFDDL